MNNLFRKTFVVLLAAAFCIIAASYQIRAPSETAVSETDSSTTAPCDTEAVGSEYTVATQPTETEPPTETQAVCVMFYTDADAVDIAKLLYRECRGVASVTEQACVAWCVLNRVDETGESIYSVIRAPGQFSFSEYAPVEDDLLSLAYDVLGRWNAERNGAEDVGRVLPKNYTYFHGDGIHNYFRNAFRRPYEIWDYSLKSPYE